jgi:PleD family two-component response regulator
VIPPAYQESSSGYDKKGPSVDPSYGKRQIPPPLIRFAGSKMAKILVFDDDSRILDTMVNYLADMGHAVFRATTIAAAKAQLREEGVEILMINKFLPHYLKNSIIRWSLTFGIPVLLMTCGFSRFQAFQMQLLQC